MSRLIRKPEDLPVYREFCCQVESDDGAFLAEGLSKQGAILKLFYNKLKDFLFYAPGVKAAFENRREVIFLSGCG
jgi:hypothetical protein